ncbi:MAG: glycosyltransferase family 2 protein [Bacilli bacterium]|nr:glycosyltransferase family 2 protein [Bacilli bacterium]
MTGIVILNYNDSKTTSTMLDSVSVFKSLDHIIVVDNASTDSSVEVLKKYESKKIDIIVNKENKGYSYGNNVGIRYLREKYKCDKVFISNPDITVSEDTLKILIKDLDKVDVVAPVISQLGENIKGWKLPSFKKEINTITSNRLFKNESIYSDDYYEDELNIVEVVSGCFFGINDSVLKKVNDFDEGTFLYFEENILGYKLKEKNIKTYVDNSVTVTHNLSVSVDKNIKKYKKYKILMNSLFYYEKNILKSNIFRRVILKFFYFVMLVLLKIKNIGGRS